MKKIFDFLFLLDCILLLVVVVTNRKYCDAFSIQRSGLGFHLSSILPHLRKTSYQELMFKSRVIRSYRTSSSANESDQTSPNKKYSPQQVKTVKSRNNTKRKTVEIQQRMKHAEEVENLLIDFIEKLRNIMIDREDRTIFESKPNQATSQQDAIYKLQMPNVREINGALATMGDSGNLIRALKMFGKMRQAAALVDRYNTKHCNDTDDTSPNRNIPTSSRKNSFRKFCLVPPTPTLVTYSTLMSRAVALGKPIVALRLWKLMTLQNEFYVNVNQTSNFHSSTSSSIKKSPIEPDIKAVNILMNAFAKLSDNHSATLLMEQVISGKLQSSSEYTNEFKHGIDIISLIQVVPKMEPNIVTYNTLIDAHSKAGDLDSSIKSLQELKSNPKLQPDARTYTSIISTVARGATLSSGASDPDLAFTFIDEMVYDMGIEPNGMTYSALIDVCGRCRRSDLALKGLRMMIRQKVKKEFLEASFHEEYNKEMKKNNLQRQYKIHPYRNTLTDEVAAWTAAINACGKAGRLDTAIRLFKTMSTNFGVKPNTITCGCLTDCLLKSNNSLYLAEIVNVIRYMKNEGIVPSEYMYTSLISSASRLAKLENKKMGELVLPEFNYSDKNDHSTDRDSTKIYTELISILVSPTNELTDESDIRGAKSTNNILVKAFLVFQEMKAAGTKPDIACYNSLLRACANAGDVGRLREVMLRLQNDGLIPNDTSWREMLRGAFFAKCSDAADEFWDMALAYKSHETDQQYYNAWVPNFDTFKYLISTYSYQSHIVDGNLKKELYSKLVTSYTSVMNGDEESGFNHINLESIRCSQKIMIMILSAVVSLEELSLPTEKEKLRDLAVRICKLDVFKNGFESLMYISRDQLINLQKMQSWDNN